MNGKNLKYFVMGAAIVAAGLGAFAITLPAAFAPGEGLSASKFNQYFTAIKTAIDNLEADNSVTTARIAANAVNAAKTEDEPGFNTIAALPSSALSASPTSKASIVVNVPAQGFVVVTADLTWVVTTSGSSSTAEFGLSNVAGQILAADAHPQVVLGGAGDSEPLSLTRVFAVSPGPNTFHLNALRTSATANQTVEGIRMTAIYLPTRYGSGASVD